MTCLCILRIQCLYQKLFLLPGLVCLLALLLGCTDQPLQSEEPADSADMPAASETVPPFVAHGDLAAPADMTHIGWEQIGPGIEWQRLQIEHQGNNLINQASASVIRLDPSAVTFHVGYTPGVPRPFSAWCAEEGVVAAINGGFFEETFHSTALVVSGGVYSGTSYIDQGGMFAVDVWGNVSLRYLSDIPYNPDEPLQEAVQGWPMLIRPGGEVLYTELPNDEPARRSVIAMDQEGRVLLLVVAGRVFTLNELASWLANSDLALDSAMNLDGGSSSGLCVQTESHHEQVNAFVPLPLVLQVFQRS